MTRYVKTLEDVRRLQKLYAEPEFEQHRGISGVYETDPEIIAAVLPPPLKPTDRPLVSVGVSHIGLSNALQPFGSAGLSVRCEYEGLVGDYGSLPMFRGRKLNNCPAPEDRRQYMCDAINTSLLFIS